MNYIMNREISKNIKDISNNEQDKKEIKKEMLLQMIMRQTNYTKEEAIENLKKWNYNTIYVMKAYLNPDFYKEKKIDEPKSTNQRMMREIRGFCDRGTRIYNLQKKMRQQQQMIQSIAQQQQQEQQQPQKTTENIVIEID